MSRNNPSGYEPDEITVAPEALKAGRDALLDAFALTHPDLLLPLGRFDAEVIVRRVYRAMRDLADC